MKDVFTKRLNQATDHLQLMDNEKTEEGKLRRFIESWNAVVEACEFAAKEPLQMDLFDNDENMKIVRAREGDLDG